MTNLTKVRFLGAIFTAVFLVGCTHSYTSNPKVVCKCPAALQEPTIAGNNITVPIAVSITPDGSGGFTFRYNGFFTDPQGNINLATGDANKRNVLLRFIIADAPAGMKFKADGREAMYIIERSLLDDPTASPTKPYDGKQFQKFNTSSDGRVLTVFDRNDDSTVYRYSLRFDFNGRTVVHDPDTSNGGGHGLQ